MFDKGMAHLSRFGWKLRVLVFEAVRVLLCVRNASASRGKLSKKVIGQSKLVALMSKHNLEPDKE